MDIKKNDYSFSELVEIIRILRAPGGCPWDVEQTHESIRNAFIEETYEAVDAIDRASDKDLCEELGDVLLQILLHSQIAKEKDSFDINDVISGIAQKMIYRHPHVFSDVKVNSANEVLDNWDKLKKSEKHQSTATQTLKSVPLSFPSLMRCEKVVKRAIKAGAEPISQDDCINEAAELLSLIKAKCNALQNTSRDFGRLLFVLATLMQQSGTDGEQVLNEATNEFIIEFETLEKSGKDLSYTLHSGNR